MIFCRYTYFPCSRRQFGLPGPSLLEIDRDERPEDGTLASSMAVGPCFSTIDLTWRPTLIVLTVLVLWQYRSLSEFTTTSFLILTSMRLMFEPYYQMSRRGSLLAVVLSLAGFSRLETRNLIRILCGRLQSSLVQSARPRLTIRSLILLLIPWGQTR